MKKAFLVRFDDKFITKSNLIAWMKTKKTYKERGALISVQILAAKLLNEAKGSGKGGSEVARELSQRKTFCEC